MVGAGTGVDDDSARHRPGAGNLGQGVQVEVWQRLCGGAAPRRCGMGVLLGRGGEGAWPALGVAVGARTGRAHTAGPSCSCVGSRGTVSGASPLRDGVGVAHT